MPPIAPPLPRRRWVLPVVGIVVALVVVLAALVVAGVGPFAPTSSAAGADETYDQASSLAINDARSYGSGSWSVIYAVGLDVSTNVSETVPTGELNSIPSSECQLNETAFFPTTISLAATSVNRSSGGAELWAFLLKSSADLGLVVWVRDGGAQALLTLSGGECSTLFALIGGIPSNAVDSSVAAAAAMRAGGYAFLRENPSAAMAISTHGDVSLGLLGGAAANWTVSLTSCPLTSSSTSVSGSTFTAQVGLTTGAVLGTPTTNTTDCSAASVLPTLPNPGGPSASTPIGTALALGAFSESTSGAGANELWYYNATVQTAALNLTWENFLLQVQTPGGTVATVGPLTAEGTNAPDSCNEATYYFARATWNAPDTNGCAGVEVGGSGLVLPGAQLRILSTSDLSGLGYILVAVGQGPYDGSAAFSIP